MLGPIAKASLIAIAALEAPALAQLHSRDSVLVSFAPEQRGSFADVPSYPSLSHASDFVGLQALSPVGRGLSSRHEGLARRAVAQNVSPALQAAALVEGESLSQVSSARPSIDVLPAGNTAQHMGGDGRPNGAPAPANSEISREATVAHPDEPELGSTSALPLADPSTDALNTSTYAPTAGAAPSITLPPLAAAVQKNLLSRLGESFTVSAPNSTRRGVVANCDTDLAYSFDDGPYIWHDELTQLFNNNSAKMSNFVNGNNWSCIYSEENVKNLRASYASGHMVGSHTWSHVHLNAMTPAQIDQEMDLIEEALWKILGVVPAIMRPPYGEANDAVVKQLNDRGYTVVTWDVDSGDSMGATAAQSLATLKALHYPGPHMPLDHETYETSALVVAPEMVPYYRKEGFKMPTIAGCLNGVAPYKIVGKPQERDDTWTCTGTPAPGVG